MDRFGGLTIWFASWWGLSTRGGDGSVTPNWLVRVLSLVLPVAAAGAVVYTKTRLDTDTAGAVVTAASLVAGALLSAFGLLAAWRERLTDRADKYPVHDQPARDMIDEAVAHILEAVRESVVVAGLGVAIWVLPHAVDGKTWGVVGVAVSALLVALATHVGVLFGFLTNQLYAGYALRNKIRGRLDGRDRVQRPKSIRPPARQRP